MAYKGARDDLTADYVREILDYDPETGVLTWKKLPRRPGKAKIGHAAGWQRPDRRIAIGIPGRGDYRAHRLIWLMMTGEWPPEEIDHIDLDPSNNRWANLRLATSSQNQAHRGLQSNNKSGHPGVFFHAKTGRWWAYIKHKGHREHIGVFDTAEKAYAARLARERQVFGQFSPPM